MDILKLALIGTLRIALFGALKVALFAYILFLPDTAYSGAKPERGGRREKGCRASPYDSYDELAGCGGWRLFCGGFGNRTDRPQSLFRAHGDGGGGPAAAGRVAAGDGR
jgi:hypothetical protein